MVEHARTRTHKSAHAHADTHAHTHTREYTHTRARTHTRTHTHTRARAGTQVVALGSLCRRLLRERTVPQLRALQAEAGTAAAAAGALEKGELVELLLVSDGCTGSHAH